MPQNSLYNPDWHQQSSCFSFPYARIVCVSWHAWLNPFLPIVGPFFLSFSILLCENQFHKWGGFVCYAFLLLLLLLLVSVFKCQFPLTCRMTQKLVKDKCCVQWWFKCCASEHAWENQEVPNKKDWNLPQVRPWTDTFKIIVLIICIQNIQTCSKLEQNTIISHLPFCSSEKSQFFNSEINRKKGAKQKPLKFKKKMLFRGRD